MMKYRKKPITIDAVQFIESYYQSKHPKYVGLPVIDRFNWSEGWGNRSAKDGRYYIPTLEGDMTVHEGDYIIKGVQGEFYPCKPDIFKLTYEKVVDEDEESN